MMGIRRKTRHYSVWSFSLGAAAYLCTESLIQDWMGREAYIQLVRENWISLPWWLWLMLIIAVMTLDWYLTRER
jgi:hypothetical protein